AEDASLVTREEFLPALEVDARSRNVAAQAVDRQQPQSKQEPLAKVGHSKDVRECFQKLRHGFVPGAYAAPITVPHPPAVSMFSVADFENRWASTVILRVSRPAPRILTPSFTLWMTPSSTRRSGVKLSPSSFSSRPRFTIAYFFLKMLVKPRLGRRR